VLHFPTITVSLPDLHIVMYEGTYICPHAADEVSSPTDPSLNFAYNKDMIDLNYGCAGWVSRKWKGFIDGIRRY